MTAPMRRKKPITINLPARIRVLGEAFAEANGRSLSSWLEDLMRADMERAGVKVDLPPTELMKAMERYLEERDGSPKPATRRKKK